MSIDPLSVAKLAGTTVQATSSVLDLATKPSGVAGRLLGVDLVKHEIKGLRDELNKSVTTLEGHHQKHEQTNLAIGALLSQVRHLQEVVNLRLDAVERLAAANTTAQDRALREFSERLELLTLLVKERSRGGA